MAGQRRACRSGSAPAGFSLIEILMAVAIFGLLVARRRPFYRHWIASQQLANHAHFLAGTLNLARSEAIKTGYRVNVCKSSDRQQCADDGSGWELGWILYVDENQDGEISAGEPSSAPKGPAQRHHRARQPPGCRLCVLHQPRATPGCFPARCRWARSSSASPARTRCRWCWPTAAVPASSQTGQRCP